MRLVWFVRSMRQLILRLIHFVWSWKTGDKTDNEVDVADMEYERNDTDFDTADMECLKLPHMEWLKLFLEFG